MEKVEYYPVDQVSDDDDNDNNGDNDDNDDQLYEDPALYSGLESGQITFTSGDTLWGWFSGDLSTVRVGELTRWSQVSWVGFNILHHQCPPQPSYQRRCLCNAPASWHLT